MILNWPFASLNVPSMKYSISTQSNVSALQDSAASVELVENADPIPFTIRIVKSVIVSKDMSSTTLTASLRPVHQPILFLSPLLQSSVEITKTSLEEDAFV